MSSVDTDSIVIGARHRKSFGDVRGLAESIASLGILHPVVIDKDRNLICGERRLRAVQILGWKDIPVTIVDLDPDAVLRAEEDENTTAKPFAPSEAAAIRKARIERETAKAKERTRTHTEAGYGKFPHPEKGASRDKAAAGTGYSGRTLDKVDEVLAAAESDPELSGLVEWMDETGKVDGAYRQVRDRLRRKTTPTLPEGQYRIIYADPPWKYSNSGVDDYGHAARHYRSLTTPEICALPVAKMAADDAVLFLWVTSPMLPDGMRVVDAWGFKYKSSFVWDKVRHNFGHYNSVRHEFLLVCTKGSCTPDNKTLFDSVVEVERTDKHSQKPERFREIIDALYPHGERLELFARRAVPNWAAWGDEM